MLAIILLVIVAVVVIAVVALFNSLVLGRNRVDNAWSQIDVQLKKRADLVPNLVETVKGYSRHEQDVFSKIAQARTALLNAKGPKEKAMANNLFSSALKTIMAIGESNPELKASANFLSLQQELSGIEEKIAYARQFYNDAVMSYNTSLQTFPNNMLAGQFGFTNKDFFEAEPLERNAPKVSF